MVNAWATANGMVLGRQQTSEHSNEITAIPALLDLLKVKGCIVSIDAEGCQTDIDPDDKWLEKHRTLDKGHGRIELREYDHSDELARSIGMVRVIRIPSAA